MSLYKRFISILEKWPIDKTKPGRDLGEHLREKGKQIFSSNRALTSDNDKLNKEITSLEKISNNYYFNLYKRNLNSTATGLTSEQCSQALASEFLEYINEDKKKYKK